MTDFEQRAKIVDTVIENCDIDNDERISKKEFVEAYMDLRLRTQDLKLDLMRQIVDGDRQENEVMSKYEEAMKSEPMFWNERLGIRNDAKLKVHIVDAVNLPENS